MQQKRLVFIIYSPFTEKPGGRETWVTNVASCMKSKGYNTTVLCYKSRRENLYNTTSNLKLIRVNTLRSLIPKFLFWAKISLGLLLILDMFLFILQSCRYVKKQIKNKRELTYFVAMSTVVEGAITWYIRKRLKYSKVILSVRGKAPLELSQTLPYLKPLAYYTEKKVLSLTKNIWANGFDTAEYLKNLGFKSKVVPNGVDYESFKKVGEKKKLTKELTVMSIATLRPIKGIPQLIKAVPKIAKLTSKKFKVVFVGAGNPERYRKLLKNSNYRRNVEFPGPIPSIEVIQNADVVACLSGGSGMSMSALEAMAAGKAIVAWDSSVYRQLFKHNKNALLVAENNTVELAKAVTTLLENPKLRTSLGINAQDAAKKYDWSFVCKEIERNLEIFPTTN